MKTSIRTLLLTTLVALAIGAVDASAGAFEAQIQLGPVVSDPATRAGVERAVEILGDAPVLETDSPALRLERLDGSRTRLVLGLGDAGPVSGRITWHDGNGQERIALVAGEIVVAPRADWPALLFRERDLATRTHHAIRVVGLPAVRSLRSGLRAVQVAAPDANGWQSIVRRPDGAEAKATLVLEDDDTLRAQFSTLEAVSVLSSVGLDGEVDWTRVRTLRERILDGNLRARVLALGRTRDARVVRAFDFAQDGLQGRFARTRTIVLPRRGNRSRLLGVRLDDPGTSGRRVRALVLAGDRVRLLDPRLGVVDRATREDSWFSGAGALSLRKGRRAFAVRRAARTQDFHVHTWDVLGDTEGTRLVGKRYRPSLSDRLGARVQRIFDATVSLDRSGWPEQPLRERLLVLGRVGDLPSLWSVRLDPVEARVTSVRTRWTGERLGNLALGRPRLHRVTSPVAGRRGFPMGIRIHLPAVQATRILQRETSGGRYLPVREVPSLSSDAAVDGFGLARPRFVRLDRTPQQQVRMIRYAVTANGLEPLAGRRLVGETRPVALRVSQRRSDAFAVTGRRGSRLLRALDLGLGAAGLPPRVDAGPDLSVRATNENGARLRLLARRRDANGDPLALRWSAPGVRFADPTSARTEAFFPIGTTEVRARVREVRNKGARAPVYEGIDLLRVTVTAPTDAPAPGLRTAIAGAFPNPFNPRTRIAFSLARGGAVELVVFDARGRRVRTLVDGARTAGPWDVVWDGLDDDGRSVASGVYHVQLTAGQTIDTARITLVR